MSIMRQSMIEQTVGRADFLPLAILGGALIGGAASIIGSKQAAKGQQAAADTASKTQLEMYYQ